MVNWPKMPARLPNIEYVFSSSVMPALVVTEARDELGVGVGRAIAANPLHELDRSFDGGEGRRPS